MFDQKLEGFTHISIAKSEVKTLNSSLSATDKVSEFQSNKIELHQNTQVALECCTVHAGVTV